MFRLRAWCDRKKHTAKKQQGRLKRKKQGEKKTRRKQLKAFHIVSL
jgi:hypothetical protein